ncbi:acyl-CoA thioesterase [Litorivivens sp.]|uniref:acyl-CoA thioesterase n=1 Tax=Litorivivens sp. TaxID=2020868 RepID=UPI0035655B46
MSEHNLWDLPTPFILKYTAEAEHIDSLNHVNNAIYVGWCQQAGWQHSQALGLGIEDYRQLDAAMAIRHAEYDYISAAYIGEQLELGTWLTQCDGRLQLERRFQLVRLARNGQARAETILRGTWKLVSICMSNGKARRMPEAFKRIYGDAVVTEP